jgi:hypothetical protein
LTPEEITEEITAWPPGEIIDWLRSDEGEAWSRSRVQRDFWTGPAPSPAKDPGPVNAAEDPCGRPPIGRGEAA